MVVIVMSLKLIDGTIFLWSTTLSNTDIDSVGNVFNNVGLESDGP